mgnify:CR=1 FL=1|jgi:hypothetical protein
MAEPTASLPIPGVKVTLRGEVFEIPPLTLDAYERFWPRIEQFNRGELSEMDACALMREVVFACVRENYPSVGEAEFKRRLDVANLLATYRLVMHASAEGRPPGEGATPRT